MKKLLVIAGIIIAFFALIVVLSNKSDEAKLKDNPYGTNKLQQSTIGLLGNENYNHIILPKELKEKIASGEPVNAYFFSPECGYCMEMTPVLMPIADKLNEEVVQYNLLEFSSEASPYDIEATPTLIHFKDGKEAGRLVGLQPAENIRLFFEEHGTNK